MRNSNYHKTIRTTNYTAASTKRYRPAPPRGGLKQNPSGGGSLCPAAAPEGSICLNQILGEELLDGFQESALLLVAFVGDRVPHGLDGLLLLAVQLGRDLQRDLHIQVALAAAPHALDPLALQAARLLVMSSLCQWTTQLPFFMYAII